MEIVLQDNKHWHRQLSQIPPWPDVHTPIGLLCFSIMLRMCACVMQWKGHYQGLHGGKWRVLKHSGTSGSNFYPMWPLLIARMHSPSTKQCTKLTLNAQPKYTESWWIILLYLKSDSPIHHNTLFVLLTNLRYYCPLSFLHITDTLNSSLLPTEILLYEYIQEEAGKIISFYLFLVLVWAIHVGS